MRRPDLAQVRGRLFRDWVLSCTAGEVVGIGVAAGVAGLLLSAIGDPTSIKERWLVLTAMVGAGLIEGLSIGYFQWRVLRRPFPTIRARSWIGVTAAVAGAGWFLGMLPSTLMAPVAGADVAFDPSPLATALLAAAAGVGAGLVFGGAQWWVLRSEVRNGGRWIVANALGWGLALAWIYVAASLPGDSGFPIPTWMLGVFAGLAAGVSVGIVTGWGLISLAPTLQDQSVRVLDHERPPGRAK